MNEFNPLEGQLGPNEMAAQIAEMEEQLKALRAEQDRLRRAVEQNPDLDYQADLDEASEKIAKLNGEIEAYHLAKKDQLELDLEPEK